MRLVESMLETTAEGLNFALWYLKQRNLIASDDKSNLLITVEGMDRLETNPPAPETMMPLIKADWAGASAGEPGLHGIRPVKHKADPRSAGALVGPLKGPF